MNRRIFDASNSAKQTRQEEAQEDRVLIARAQKGDRTAFRQLVERHQHRAFTLAFSLVRDEGDACELVQDAFVRVYKNLPNFKGDSSFFTWLYRIVTNLSIDLRRKAGRRVAEIDEERFESEETGFPFLSRVDGANPVDVVRRSEIAARVQAALDALPLYHRGVIVMRDIQGYSYDEIASAMGISKGTVMSRLFYARRKLQEVLADCYEEQVGRVPARTGRTDTGEEES